MTHWKARAGSSSWLPGVPQDGVLPSTTLSRVSPFYCDCKEDQGEARPLVLPANAGPTNRESCKGLGKQMEGPDAHLQRTIEKMNRGQAVPKYQCFPDLGPRDCSVAGVAPGIYKTPNLISKTSGLMVMLDAPLPPIHTATKATRKYRAGQQVLKPEEQINNMEKVASHA